MTGPASATDNAIVRFDGTTGKLVQNSGVTITDTNDLDVAGRFAAGNFADVTTAGRVFDMSQTITDLTAAANWTPFREVYSVNASVNFAGTLTGHYLSLDISGTETYNILEAWTGGIQYASSGAVNNAYGNNVVNNISGAGAHGVLVAGVFVQQASGSGSASYNVGLQAYPRTSGTVVVNQQFGIEARSDVAIGSTVTSSVLFKGRTPSVAGTLDQHFGIYLDDQDRGTVNYAIYTNAGKIRFGDLIENLGIIAPAVSPGGSGRIYFDSGTNTYRASQNGGAYFDIQGAPSTASFITMSAESSLPNERRLVGTASQIIVTDNGAGNTVTLSTPQDIKFDSAVEFASVTLGGGFTQGSILFMGASSVISQDATALNWNATSNLLGIGKNNQTATVDIAQTAVASGSPIGFDFTGGAHTTLTASTGTPDIRFALGRTVQWATGNLDSQFAINISAPTYGFVGASTIEFCATMTFDRAPLAGTNASITNAFGFLAGAGDGVNGTNNYNIAVLPFGIASGKGAMTLLTGLGFLSGGDPISLGDQTATLTTLASIYLPAISYESSTNVRTVTNADGVVLNAPVADTNVTFTNPALALRIETGGLGMQNISAPASVRADSFTMYANDITAGNSAPHFRTEGGNVIKLFTSSAYTITNVSADRAYDANSTSLDEIADCLGTLIADLKLTGILG